MPDPTNRFATYGNLLAVASAANSKYLAKTDFKVDGVTVKTNANGELYVDPGAVIEPLSSADIDELFETSGVPNLGEVSY